MSRGKRRRGKRGSAPLTMLPLTSYATTSGPLPGLPGLPGGLPYEPQTSLNPLSVNRMLLPARLVRDARRNSPIARYVKAQEYMKWGLLA